MSLNYSLPFYPRVRGLDSFGVKVRVLICSSYIDSVNTPQASTNMKSYFAPSKSRTKGTRKFTKLLDIS